MTTRNTSLTARTRKQTTTGATRPTTDCQSDRSDHKTGCGEYESDYNDYKSDYNESRSGPPATPQVITMRPNPDGEEGIFSIDQRAFIIITGGTFIPDISILS